MKSRLLDELVPQVKENCLISDARFWGYYSICGLLLRLRELYRFEHGIEPWETAPEGGITDWIGQRESGWEELSEAELKPLTLDGREFAPFDVEEINSAINEAGLLYGAGYGLYGKPVFYLGDLESRESVDGYDIFISGREYARDLSIHPAMLQHRRIYARREICTLLIWEKFEEFRAKRTASALSVAFSAYGVEAGADAESLRRLINEAADTELRTYIYHELGEAFESDKAGAQWAEMLSSVLSSKASMFARAVMDTMADASERGLLKHIVDERKAGSLAFYMTFLGGYRRVISEDMVGAFEGFSESRDWGLIEAARTKLYSKAELIAENIMRVYGKNGGQQALIDGIQREITLLQPSS
jgi:hypothetical protein